MTRSVTLPWITCSTRRRRAWPGRQIRLFLGSGRYDLLVDLPWRMLHVLRKSGSEISRPSSKEFFCNLTTVSAQSRAAAENRGCGALSGSTTCKRRTRVDWQEQRLRRKHRAKHRTTLRYDRFGRGLNPVHVDCFHESVRPFQSDFLKTTAQPLTACCEPLSGPSKFGRQNGQAKRYENDSRSRQHQHCDAYD